MNDNNEILSGFKTGNRDRSVPEGYFDDLQARLSSIPADHPVGKRLTARAFFPALAGAAAAAIAAAFILTRTSAQIRDDGFEMISYEQYAIADLIPRTDPYIFFADEAQLPDSYSDEDIAEYIEYLIEH